jgi:hypothetical protein
LKLIIIKKILKTKKMGGKAKPTKHTAKEIAGKIHLAKMKAGGCGGG